jgi:shikimate kinase
MDRLNEIGTTVYLKLEPEFIVQRLLESKIKRPLIEGMTPIELQSFIEKKSMEREVFYELANLLIRPDRNFKMNIINILKR